LDNVAGEESVKYRGYLCTSTTKKKGGGGVKNAKTKKRLQYILKFWTPASGVLPSRRLAANEINCKYNQRMETKTKKERQKKIEAMHLNVATAWPVQLPPVRTS
jgi:hypothetical protein